MVLAMTIFLLDNRTFHYDTWVGYFSPCVGVVAAVSRMMVALIAREIALAVLLFPILVFTEPSNKGPFIVNTRDKASTSIGSPDFVPGP